MMLILMLKPRLEKPGLASVSVLEMNLAYCINLSIHQKRLDHVETVVGNAAKLKEKKIFRQNLPLKK